MKNKIQAIGLMCGTSVDALDIAHVEISDGKKIKMNLLNFKMVPIPSELKNKIMKSFEQNITSRFLCSLNFEIANFYANEVNKFIKENKLNKEEIKFISSHGQTIYHLIDPNDTEAQSTLQLGDISVIAKKTKITTIGDFRPADIAVGGQGAPLVPKLDQILYKDKNKIRLFQNIGGMSNVSVIGDHPLAFDNGPGNVLIDKCMKYFYNQDYDKDAKIALSGKVNKEILEFLKNDPYYEQKPPKSTGREKYSDIYFKQIIDKFNYVSPKDIISTITFFTAYIIADSYNKFIIKDDKKYEVYVCGGGANNPFIVKTLQKLLKPIKVYDFGKLGITSDSKEAAQFALLGYLTYTKQSGNLTSSTGAFEEVILGKIAY
ncbi:anhydro-N-acetylmuramic acid kinase [Mycoplasmopsis anatis]|uniref:anhydro-N-acetylmuramic acid kinase n=1 Tax=Mycoplasmopsis anatis TaxID=171279 RepID=UPI001C4E2084|nr:anhydro-N-acetylmuramic acid kinase [Mycoplasmopsis anatis]MBW0594370.1 anhydro-N-acetylmuramic acid kinase [Mycoplasmopsis anatis]MBW0595009.1 anhydro-N-acetylmuramic acid kinase [Mycoplasmopsis anatis]MBW0598240.1 anhydro-N-acetylmuramic acid kinase [Mycoplasmopsis anatis]MBW0598749.1 anhydro-N-acetylmuramic acid kinase [Mycoplasmopsis anatis]MBW0600956.1 anhydro-N-acetylmuramic acid kinase [Mycoplasmopsis anatis]